MASAPPVSASPDRKQQAAALALLLTAAKKRYSLPALIQAQRIRPRPFRQIRPTNALAASMAAPHFAIVRAWQAALPDILAAVPFGQAAVASAIEQAAARIGVTVAQAKAQFSRVVAQIEAWHRAAWIDRVRASTSLDVSMFTQASDVADTTQAIASWNGALADDVHSQVKTRLAAALLVGAASSAAAKAKAAETITKARKRAALIGTDQTSKASAGMTRDRMSAAGIGSWLWLHQDQKYPRPVHLARNGKTFNSSNAPDDMPGTLPNCKCSQLPLLQ